MHVKNSDIIYLIIIIHYFQDIDETKRSYLSKNNTSFKKDIIWTLHVIIQLYGQGNFTSHLTDCFPFFYLAYC